MKSFPITWSAPATPLTFDRKKVLNTFAEYTSHYNAKDPKVKLKIDHTYRVAGLCQVIAASLGLSEYEQNLAWLIGMLHDVGRFEQIKRYNSFNDATTVDHARFGADLLFLDRLIDSYVINAEEAEDTALVELAIRQHNTYRIPEELTDRQRCFCDLIRDADKIDILRVNVETPIEEIYNCTTEDLRNSFVTPEVMDSFYEHHCVLKAIRKSAVDHVVGHISLAYELVYPKSVELTAAQGYLDKLMDFASFNPDTLDKFATIREEMHRYQEMRLRSGE